MEPHILIKYASRSRPQRFFEGLHSIIDLAADPEHLSIQCILDQDDVTMNADDVKTRIKVFLLTTQWSYDRCFFDYGHSKSKIDAINRPILPHIHWDILVNFSDDMRFTVFGWDQIIREGFRCNGEDLFLHYPDSTARNSLPTMSVMDRAYFERDGYIYHPSYLSLWCDNEAQDVAKMRGRYRYMGIQIFDHFHPAYGHVPWDPQYERQQAYWGEDEKNYYHRKSKNFFLDAAEYTHSDR